MTARLITHLRHVDLAVPDLRRQLDFLDPHGNTVEYTTELEIIDEDTWHPHFYDFSQQEVADQWGTANAMNEFLANKSFNDVDKGLFVAPPVCVGAER